MNIKSEIRNLKPETNLNNNQKTKFQIGLLFFKHLSLFFVSNFEFRTSDFFSRKRVLVTALLFFAISGKVWALPASDLAQFENANRAYRESKFEDAVSLYKMLAEKYPSQPAFYFNLGNALHRSGEHGTAILAYERARRLAPRQGDILANLNYARSLLEYKVEDKRLGLVQLADTLLGFFRAHELNLFALLAVFLGVSSWAFVLFFKADTSWGGIRKTLSMITLIAVALASFKGIQENFFHEAIVTVKEAQVYYGPSVTDQPAFRLGDGLKAYVLDSREGWNRILIPSGESGWIQSDQITKI